MSLRANLIVVALLLGAACRDGSTGPGGPPDAIDLARQFDATATTMERGGERERATAMRGAAALLRLTREVSVIDVAIDAASARWLGVGLQVVLTTPDCGPDLAHCAAAREPVAARLLFAWRGDRLDQLLFLVTDTSGRAAVSPPFTAGGALVPGSGFPPGVLPTFAVPTVAVLADPAARRSWVAIFGGATSALTPRAGACELPPLLADVDARCHLASLRFGLDVRAIGLPRESEGGVPSRPEFRRIVVREQRVAGAVLRVNEIDFGGFPGLPAGFPLRPSGTRP